MPQTYRLYGLTLQSTLTLPCRISRSAAPPDVVLRSAPDKRFAAARNWLAGAGRSTHWFAFLRLPDGGAYLRWRGLAEFLVSRDGRRILYHRDRKAPSDSFAVYLLGQVLSFSLLARGVEPLHGTVSIVGGKAVAFVGDCGRGKSTLAAAMLGRKCPVLTDDLVVLDERRDGWMVHPGVARIKLFPAVARRLLGRHAASGTTMNSGTPKLVLPLAARHAGARSTPLHAVYVLSPPGREPSAAAPVRVERLEGAQALIEIVRAAFNLHVTDRDRLANQFSFASRLAGDVPVRRLIYPRRLSFLPAVCEAVVSDLV